MLSVNRPHGVVSNDLEELVQCVEITDGSFERPLGVTISSNYADLHRKQRLDTTLSVIIEWIEKGARPDKSEAVGFSEDLRANIMISLTDSRITMRSQYLLAMKYFGELSHKFILLLCIPEELKEKTV